MVSSIQAAPAWTRCPELHIAACGEREIWGLVGPRSPKLACQPADPASRGSGAVTETSRRCCSAGGFRAPAGRRTVRLPKLHLAATKIMSFDCKYLPWPCLLLIFTAHNCFCDAGSPGAFATGTCFQVTFRKGEMLLPFPTC